MATSLIGCYAAMTKWPCLIVVSDMAPGFFQFQILKGVVHFILVLMVDIITLGRNDACVLPPYETMPIDIPSTVAATRIVYRSYDKFIRTVSQSCTLLACLE